MKDFGPRLRQLREERGLSQAEFARLLSLDAMQVNRYERGINVPSCDTAVRIAKVLRISLDELLAGKKGSGDPLRIKHAELFDRFRRVDDLTRKDIEAAVVLLDGLIARAKLAGLAAEMTA